MPTITGGPAFPIHPPVQQASPGLTKREWFAGQALQGFLAGAMAGRHSWSPNEAVKESYRLADLMVKEGGT